MLSLIEQIAPGTLRLLIQRQEILKEIHALGPIGRRALANQVGLSERTLRTEIEVLKHQELITTSSAGMRITTIGNQVIQKLETILDQQSYLHEMEQALAAKLGISECRIQKSSSQLSLAEMTVDIIDKILPDGDSKIAVMGGTTLRSIAKQFDESLSNNRSLLFLPARGGTGEKASLQANTIADIMATKTHGASRLLYAPEHVRSETHSLLLQEPEIKETLQFLSESILVIFSIGDANQMARRIGLDEGVIDELNQSNAVAEAFGEFIDKDGQVVYKLARIGLSSEDIRNIPHLLAVASGKEKAKAIEAYFKVAPPHTILVTDVAAANEILNRDNPFK